ncbi:PREDICTED: ubiquitin carboxyl-terminal hydrolase 5-like [Amphimedon queenslandica]|uniref:Ubiquitin carboxyl-terminal hydrolase 14 n=1 Tax=Amphimedon queenslandica TaxID=400682 RepID=A0AAN0IKY8_AMPQE|nr:PREDICTED: ubiquitin carboxyl-terminal hydrolase 5-like [Amphimedon queenslandica]|eukprot:XP_011402875.2 PREDICTED: ubiquitin carboxyl-terminal hydrolase 5-like [Amphimedon queenslandica]
MTTMFCCYGSHEYKDLNDVEVDVPESLDISSLRGGGIQPGEVELPEETGPAQPEVEIDEGVLSQLAGMGFDIEGCKRAIYHTKNQGIEPAMNWVLEHMGDPDFTDPFVPPGSVKSAGGGADKGGGASEDSIAIVMSLGFTREQAMKALKATDNNVERAADWVFSHMDELQQMEEGEGEEPMEEEQFSDGSGKYSLIAFISHMGTSTMTGHYVCHIKKDGKWIIFNDNKVAESVAPPKDHAYLYFYKREH